jgi:carboxymethylenebutenolidase
MGQFIQLTASDGHAFEAYETIPTNTTIGTLVLVQEIFGVNTHIQAIADLYASIGYRVLAVPTMDRVQKNVNLGYTPEDMQAGSALKAQVEALPNHPVMLDLQVAINHLKPFGKVGIFGFCYGGLLTWRSACQLSGLSAAVAYYGGGAQNEHHLIPQCAVMAHFAEEDSYIPLESVEAFKKARPEVEVHIYAGHHGFNCDHRASYFGQSAQVARTRTLDFFQKHLGN